MFLNFCLVLEHVGTCMYESMRMLECLSQTICFLSIARWFWKGMEWRRCVCVFRRGGVGGGLFPGRVTPVIYKLLH